MGWSLDSLKLASGCCCCSMGNGLSLPQGWFAFTWTSPQMVLWSLRRVFTDGRNSAAFASTMNDEFVAASSNNNRLQIKCSRMPGLDHFNDAGVAPTPLLSARMFTCGDAVLMVSEHRPDRGSPLRVTRLWVKRIGNWVETLSYQTAVTVAAAP